MTTIEISYGNSIVFKDTNTVTWSKSRSQNCVVTVQADAKFNPCQTLLTGMKMNVSCESITPKDTICAALAKLQCQIDNSGGSGTVTSVDANDLDPLFTASVANPTTDAVISFSAISQNANLFYASPSGVAGIPLFREIVFADIAGLIAEPNTQIVYGTGTFIDSSPNFTYDVATNILTLANTNNASNGIFKSNEQCEINSVLDSAPFLILGILSLDASQALGSVSVTADDGVTNQGAGLRFLGYPAVDTFVSLFYQENADTADIIYATKEFVALNSFTGASTSQILRFMEAAANAGGNYFAVKAPDSITTNRTMLWPNDDPSAGEVLSVTSFALGIITTEWASAGALISIGTIDSVAASANGAAISGSSIIMQSASATVPGLVNITTQTFAGDKTFSASTVSMNKNGSQVLAVGTTSFVFRTTNAGANVQAQVMFDPDNSVSTAGAQGFAFETANGLVFTAANGTRRIARASIKLANLTNTAGAEAGDLIFLTQSGGTAVSQKFRISALGNIVAGNEAALATTATDGDFYVPSCAGVPTGVPSGYTGKIALRIDSTNSKAYIYSGGAWVALN